MKLFKNPRVWWESPLPPGVVAQYHKMRHTAQTLVINSNYRGNNVMWEMGRQSPIL